MILAAGLLLVLSQEGLSENDFVKLKPGLEIKSKPWATLAWQVSVRRAREVALESRRPIFMMVDTGNPIGCA